MPVSSMTSCNKRRHHGWMVHAHFGKDGGHGERVGDVRMTGAAELTFVRFARIFVGSVNLSDLIRESGSSIAFR